MIYVGYEIPSEAKPGLGGGVTITRSFADDNSAWGFRNNGWEPLSQSAGIGVALGLALEVSDLYEDFGSQIKVLTNPVTDGLLTLDLGNLVYDELSLDVYTVEGKRLMSSSQISDHSISVRFTVPVSGIYLVQLRIDHLDFTKKILVMRNQ